MKTLFSIGEMSKIHNVSIKTLRYYDQIGLFIPAKVDEESGYRYYNYRQFEQINTILFLKYLGIPLKEIKSYLEQRDKKTYKEMLLHEKAIVAEKIKVLNQINKGLDVQIEELLETEKERTLGIPFIKEIEKRAVIKLDSRITSTFELEIALHKLKEVAGNYKPLISGRVGVSISESAMIKGTFEGFDAVFIMLDEKVESKQYKEYSSGTYGVIEYRGNDHSDSDIHYMKLVDFIKEQGYYICGDSFERVLINEYKSNDPSEYLTEIQIPIQKI